jgi:hypothetical protein
MTFTPSYFLSQLAELSTSSSGYLYFNSTTGTFSTGTPTSSSVAWSTLTGAPTTLSGYGITDAINASALSAAISAQHTTDTGLFATIASLNPGSLLASNGYQKLPSGLILQWGITASVANSAILTVTFPIPFPTACVFADDIPVTLNPVVQAAPIANTLTVTGFNLENNTGIANTYHWFALGF